MCYSRRVQNDIEMSGSDRHILNDGLIVPVASDVLVVSFAVVDVSNAFIMSGSFKNSWAMPTGVPDADALTLSVARE